MAVIGACAVAGLLAWGAEPGALGATEPALTLSSSSIAFGNVPLTTPTTRAVTLKSSGTSPLTITSATLSGAPAFTISGASFPITLNEGQAATLTVKCDASAAGTKTGTITLSTNTSSRKATISLSATAIAGSGLTPSRSFIAFGNVAVNTPLDETVTLESSGSESLTISSGTVTGAPAFRISGATFPVTLKPGQSKALTIECDPGTTGAKTGVLTLATNAPNKSSSIGLAATAVDAPGLTLSATSVAFGDVTVNTVVKRAVTLMSSGESAVTITSGAISGTAAFKMSGITFPLTLKPGQSAMLTIDCDPGVAGGKTATVTLATNAPHKASTLSVSATGITPPALTLSAGSLAFGDITLNKAATRAVTLRSTGQSALTIRAGTVSGSAGFSLSGVTFPVTLNDGKSVTLTVKCDPTTAGAKAATLKLTTNAPNGSSRISLSATGLTPPALTLSAGSVGFGNVTLNTPVSKAVTLKSTGQTPLTITAGTLSGSAGFALSGVSYPLTLNDGNSATLTIRCDPSAAGTMAATVKLTTNAGSTTISLSATGKAGTTPGLTLGSTSVSFGDVGLNTPATQSVMLTSSGNAAVTISGVTAVGTGFSIAGPAFPLTLQPGQTAAMEIQFDPTTAGAEAGTVTVTSNASSGTPTVSLSGTGANTTSSQVDLNWDAPSNAADPATGYNIYRAVLGSTNYQLLNSSPETTTTYQDKTAAAGTSYSYYVVSVDADGEQSGPSNPFTVTVSK